MPSFSFEDDLFDAGIKSVTVINKEKKKTLVSIWKEKYTLAYGKEFEAMGDASLFVACGELDKFCKENSLSFETYIYWGMQNFDVFSPRRLLNPKFLDAYRSTLIPEGTSTGFFIIETGVVVDSVYLEDGQISYDLPTNGEVYIDGNVFHALRV